MYNTILAAIDLEDKVSAKDTFQKAQQLAQINNAKLYILSVIPSYGTPLVGSFFPEKHSDDAEQRYKDLLHEFVKENGGDQDIPCLVTSGTIYDEILNAANKLDCDLIVLAANRPELKDYLLGPNAARVVRHARQSVFVVRNH